MTTQEIFKLVDAGFTKDDIMVLAGSAAQTVQEKAQATESTQSVPIVSTNAVEQNNATAAQSVPEKQTPAQNTVTMSDAQFNQLMQKLNTDNASIDIPPKYDIKNVLGEHFKDLMIGG